MIEKVTLNSEVHQNNTIVSGIPADYSEGIQPNSQFPPLAGKLNSFYSSSING
ncbi:MAG: hypothetical protein RLN79_11615 [Cytophagales bacterium]